MNLFKGTFIHYKLNMATAAAQGQGNQNQV